MFIQTEETPNPLSLKFLLNIEIAPDGYCASFAKNGDMQSTPNFVQDILSIPAVLNVTVFSHFVTASIEEGATWNIIKPEIIHILLEHAQSTGLKIATSTEEPEAKREFSGIEKEIVDLIEERVKPAVEMDGGDIEFVRFDEETGIVYVKMKGSCDGCPSSSATLNGGIKRMLEYYVPEVTDVQQI